MYLAMRTAYCKTLTRDSLAQHVADMEKERSLKSCAWSEKVDYYASLIDAVATLISESGPLTEGMKAHLVEIDASGMTELTKKAARDALVAHSGAVLPMTCGISLEVFTIDAVLQEGGIIWGRGAFHPVKLSHFRESTSFASGKCPVSDREGAYDDGYVRMFEEAREKARAIRSGASVARSMPVKREEESRKRKEVPGEPDANSSAEEWALHLLNRIDKGHFKPVHKKPPDSDEDWFWIARGSQSSFPLLDIFKGVLKMRYSLTLGFQKAGPDMFKEWGMPSQAWEKLCERARMQKAMRLDAGSSSHTRPEEGDDAAGFVEESAASAFGLPA